MASGVGVGVLEGSGAADGRTEGEGAGFTDGFTACTVGAGVTTTWVGAATATSPPPRSREEKR